MKGKSIDKRKLYGSILGIIAFLAVLVSFSYAFYTWKSDEDIVTLTISDSYFYCESGIDNDVSNLSPVLDYRNGSYQTFKVNNIGRNNTTFSLSLNITSISDALKDKSFKYVLVVDKTGGDNNCASVSNGNCVEVANGDFSNVKVGMNTLIETINLPNNVRYQYYLFMYIDGNEENSTALQGSSMTSTLGVCEVVVFFDYNGGTGNKEFMKVSSTYKDLPSATRPSINVIYNTNDGSSVTNGSISYTFDGWYTAKSGGIKVIDGNAVSITTNHTLYAKWNSSEIPLEETSRDGYTFTGWYSDSALTKKVGDAGDKYTIDSTENVNLYAGWQAQLVSYKVEHYVMDTIGGYPTTATYIEDKTGYTDSPLKLSELKDSSKEVANGIIYDYGKVDGNTVTTTKIKPNGVIKLYYKRTYGKLKIVAGTNIAKVAGQDTVNFVPYYYGATVPTLTATLASSTGYTYTFDKWTSSNTTYISNKTTSTISSFAWPAMPEGTEITLTASATKTANPYTVEYYNGSTKLGSSNHTYGNAKSLTTWSTLGGVVTNSTYGWTFEGWSISNSNTTRDYTDGQSVSNLTSTNGAVVKLYSVYKRTITFKSGVNCATSSTAIQYWNPYGTTDGTHVFGVTSPSLTSISKWIASGFRNDTTAGDKEYNSGTTIYPVPGESSTLYGVYSRTITFKSGVSEATTDGTRTQYLNSNDNAVSAITTYTPAGITNWTTLGYRNDTTASAKECSSAASCSLAYTTETTMYAVYSRTLTISYNANGGSGTTASTTKTVYLNTNSTTTSDQTITLASNGFTRTGHTFNKWNTKSDGSGTDYATGASYNPNVSYSAATFGTTLYAKWNAHSYTIAYTMNGGTKGTNAPTT